MPYDTGFAKRRFPDQAGAIDALAARSESFRDLCLDLEAADDIRRQWEGSKAPEAPSRLREINVLVHELSEEMLGFLESASVIPFGRPPGRR